MPIISWRVSKKPYFYKKQQKNAYCYLVYIHLVDHQIKLSSLCFQTMTSDQLTMVTKASPTNMGGSRGKWKFRPPPPKKNYEKSIHSSTIDFSLGMNNWTISGTKLDPTLKTLDSRATSVNTVGRLKNALRTFFYRPHTHFILEPTPEKYVHHRVHYTELCRDTINKSSQ